MKLFTLRSKRIAAAALAAMLMLPVFSACEEEPPAPPAPEITHSHDVSVIFVNVGYGDAAVISIDGHVFVIDTGKKSAYSQLSAALGKLGTSTVEGLFLTHPHSDHIGGMKKLCENYKVNNIYSPAVFIPGGDSDKISERAAESSVRHTLLYAGDFVEAAEDVRFEVIGPVVTDYKDDNDNSLVLRLCVNGRTLLFTGDMQFSEELTMLESGASLAADILKVGNHGNPDATSLNFANAVGADFAVISTDTSEDADSASPRVIAALGNADVRITQDYTLGVLVSVGRDGSISVQAA